MQILQIVLAFVAAYLLFVTVFYGLVKICFDKIEVDDKNLPDPVKRSRASELRLDREMRRRARHVLQKM